MNSNERFLNVKSVINYFLRRFTSTLCMHLHTCQAHFFMNYIHTPVEVLSYPDCTVLNAVCRIGLQMKWGLTLLTRNFSRLSQQSSRILKSNQVKDFHLVNFFSHVLVIWNIYLRDLINFFLKASVSKWTLRVKNLMVKLLLDACHQFCVFKSE